MRPRTPLAVENGVGKLAANWAPNVSTGKRAWRTPIPHFVPVRLQGRTGTFAFLACFDPHAAAVKENDLLRCKSILHYRRTQNCSFYTRKGVMGRIYNDIVETVGRTPL